MKRVNDLMNQAAKVLREPQQIARDVPIKVGVDLGTAYTVLFVTDEAGWPLAAVNQFADVVRDGIVWDFAGARDIVTGLRERLEEATGREIASGAVTVPPAVGNSDHRAHGFVLEGAGIECDAVIDETTAANAILHIDNGAVVDIGGGTTGVAILRGGEIVANFDEPTGGKHMSLVIAGALGISLEEAEQRKIDPAEQPAFLNIVRPTIERVAQIVNQSIQGEGVEQIHLVGGTASFPGFERIIAQATGLPCSVAPHPMLVTPLGVAQWAKPLQEA